MNTAELKLELIRQILEIESPARLREIQNFIAQYQQSDRVADSGMGQEEYEINIAREQYENGETFLWEDIVNEEATAK